MTKKPTSFFGGDHSVSHFSCGIPYFIEGEDRLNQRAATQRRKEQNARLREIGYKPKYFQFKNDDAAGKEAARKQCQKYAAKWSAKAGFELVVQEGFFM